MTEIFSDQLIGKKAITSGGYPIGIIEEIVVDTETGELKYLLVRPDVGAASMNKTDGKGRAVITIGTLKIADENVIVS